VVTDLDHLSVVDGLKRQPAVADGGIGLDVLDHPKAVPVFPVWRLKPWGSASYR